MIPVSDRSTNTHRPDAECLLAWAERGDEAAFRLLVARHGGMMLAAALRTCQGERPLAEDACQRVFVILAKKAQSLTSLASLGARLHRAVTLECAHLIRGETRRKARMNAYAEQTDHTPTPLPDHLDVALERLSQAEREILFLHHLEGRGFREIGALVGRSEAAVQKQASRALARLRVRGGILTGAIALAAPLPSALADTFARNAISQAATMSGLQATLTTLFYSMSGKTLLAALIAQVFLVAAGSGSYIVGASAPVEVDLIATKNPSSNNPTGQPPQSPKSLKAAMRGRCTMERSWLRRWAKPPLQCH
jgi:RNA polymerase sigma factor (sigma-70 family)